ncbi:hypothetical protein KCV87_15740 [Actinosynnema pretiosum subsp. pretiosum]|uniref:Band 7 domain-containing protein n=1 Tax=Actinosynnema pretiosum subsp. pretiosum TaxID=103721 RepID=A0AA45LDP4_9PSEU|nr:hypothetical protein APASM_0918 [Actinosynnema pretiosum subsp. pretiosum]QUF07348.1 hypothetical protein KCV87_15740 [Actinosynnema pretiosum subsp. pretiosum]
MINHNPSHTTPLIEQVDVRSFGLFKSRPVPRSDRATVYLDRNGQYHHMTRQLLVGDGLGMRALFLVDTSVVNRTLVLDTPSQERAYQFTASVTASWQVTDPVEVVRTNLLDAEFLVRKHITRKLHDVTTRHPIEEIGAAEAEVRAVFGSGSRRNLGQGLALLDCEVRLRLDEGAANEVRRRKERIRHLDQRILEHDLHQREAKLRSAELAAQAAVNAQQAEYDRARERRQQLHEQEMRLSDMAHYANAIRNDELNLVALRLSQNPGDAKEVLAMFMQQRKLDFESARGVLNALMDKGLVTRGNSAGIMAQATAVIANQLSGTGIAADFGAAVPLPSATSTSSAPSAPGPAGAVKPAKQAGPSVDQLFGPVSPDDEYDEDA